VDVHHQSDDAPPAPIADAYARAGISAKVSPFIDDVPAAYAWADFAITRAGAGTLAELAVAGLPALLVPLADAARDHQRDNADAAAAAGAALWVSESGWDAADLSGRLVALLAEGGAWTRMAVAARRLAIPGAADAVVDDCEALMRGRW
jgi:UDP-N-acetylglucosamine--N-acetylmuramyl-(pentapeptide) pyrophosphoryl-undecaprenol N-acetylglucosamine transferase